MRIEYVSVGECVELYVDGEYVKLFNGSFEWYINQIAAENYVSEHYHREK